MLNTEEQLNYFPWNSASTHKASYSLQSADVWYGREAWSLPSILTHFWSMETSAYKAKYKGCLHHSPLEHVVSASPSPEPGRP